MAYLVDFNTDYGSYTLQFRKKAGNGATSFRKQAAIVHFIDFENPVEYAEKGSTQHWKVHCALYKVCPYVHLLYVSETLYNSRN